MLYKNGKSGLEPARWAPGRTASGLFLALALLFAWPCAGEVDAQESDPAAEDAAAERETPAREVRPALAKRKRNALNQFQFDPKVFEARGRELRDEYYEITSTAKGATAWSASQAGQAGESAAGETGTSGSRAGISDSKSGSKNWMIWSGAAGLAALVGGAAGYLLLEKHAAPDPVTVDLSDDPNVP